MNRTGILKDRRAATVVIFAAVVMPLMAAVGLVIDVGNVFTAKRQLQGTTDLAAIAAATNLPNALSAAQANASVNGYRSADVTDVQLGHYSADPTVAASQRFVVGSAEPPNAALVTMTHQQPLFFGPILALAGESASQQNSRQIITQGLATISNTAGFSIGSTVASVSGGIPNAVLGAVVGGNVALSAIDYGNLASAKVDLFSLANALSVQAGQVGGTYQQGFSGVVTMENFLAALQTVAPAASIALEELRSAASSGGQTVDLSKLVELGPYSQLPVSGPEPHISANASALSLVQAAGQVGGPSHLLSVSFGADIPGIASGTALITLGEPMQGTIIAIDQIGASVHTAQVRIFLSLSLLGSAPAPAVQLPLYVEVGYGTATLTSLSCSPLDATTTQATLNVTPGLVNGWIGTVTAAQINNYTSEPAVSPATFLNLGVVSVTGEANAQVGNTTATPVSFSYTEIQNGTVKSVSTEDYAATLFASLLSRTSYQVNGVGVPGLQAGVANVLSGSAVPVDGLLDNLFTSLGLAIGQANTTVNSARCGAAVLAG